MTTATGGTSRLPLTMQMSLLFATAMVGVVVAVSGLMYVELMHELRDKELAELRTDLALQSAIVAAPAAKGGDAAYWQREWQENKKAHGQFGWQVVAADGAVREASSNWPDFAQAVPGRVLVETVKLGRIAGDGNILRGALDISRDLQVLDAYRSRLVALALLAAALSAGLAWSLVRYGLAPLGAFSNAARRASGQAAHRLSMSRPLPRELCQLAATFEDLQATVMDSSARLSKISSEFASELRAPIENMMAASSVMLSRARDVAEYQQTLEVVLDEGARLSHLLANMLFLVRAENGDHDLRRETLALAAEFGRLVDFFDLSFEERGTALVATGECALYADPALLRRALSILLTNVLRHVAAGDVVRLSCAAEQGATLVSLQASGAVTATEPMMFLVGWFQRDDRAGSALECVGIELAVVRSIMQLHGGTVDASGCPGQALRIVLRFPTVLSQDLTMNVSPSYD